MSVYVADERLSSAQAAERLGRRAVERDQGKLDSMAAAVILDTFFHQEAPRAIQAVPRSEVMENLTGP